MEKRLRSISDAAVTWGVSTFTVRRAIERGEVKAVRVLRRILIPQHEIDRVCTQGCGQPQHTQRAVGA